MFSLFIDILLGIHILVSLLIIFIVLMQRPKSEGIGAAFGGEMMSEMFANTSNVLANAPRWLGGFFFFLTLLLSILSARQSTQKSSIQAAAVKAAEAAAAAATPAPAATPAATGTATATATAGTLSNRAAITVLPAAPTNVTATTISSRQVNLSWQESTTGITGFVIQDNGIGFTDEHFRSFQTSDTTYKAKTGGKGIGRLLWLKAFSKAEVESTFNSTVSVIPVA